MPEPEFSRGFQRLMQWTRSLFQSPTPTTAGPVYARHELTHPIVVPARGHVFHFQIGASLLWSAQDLDQPTLAGWALQSMPRARRELYQLAKGLSRNHFPHRARNLEIELSRAVSDPAKWTYWRHGQELRCRPEVRVELDPRVEEQMRPYWERRIQLECEYEIKLRRTELTEQLTRQWLSILAKLSDHPLAAAAAQLTEKELAEVVEKIVTEQKDAMHRLHALLNDILRNTADMGAYERAETLDLLVEELRGQLRTRP